MIMIVNPGVNPELIYASMELVKVDECLYVTSLVFGKNGKIDKTLRKLNSDLLISKFLMRRVVELDDSLIVRSGLHWEILQVLVRGRFPLLNKYFISLRNKKVHSKARRIATKYNPKFAFIHYTDAVKTLNELQGMKCTTILNYPIAHHGWMRSLVNKEHEINPKLVKFLQIPDQGKFKSGDLTREIELADLILVGSSFVKSTFVDQGVESSRIRTINLGVNLQKFRIDPNRTYPGSDAKSPLRLVFTGQLSQRKGLSYLFDAVRNYGAEVELTLIGLAPDKGYMNLLDTPTNSKFLGYRSRLEMSEIYSSHDIFIFPSLAEGFPLAAIEAMAHGLGIIITKNTFGSDVVDDGVDGFIVSAQNSDEIRQAIDRFLTDRKLIEAFGKSASKKSAIYNWNRYQKEISKLIEELSIASN